MQEAIDMLITAFAPHSCLAIPRRADRSLLFTITDRYRAVTVTRVIPLRDLGCNTSLAILIKDLQRDMAHAVGALDSQCLTDLRVRGARLLRFET